MPILSLKPLQKGINPSLAWLIVFLPAVSYFVASRLSRMGLSYGGRSSWTLGPLAASQVHLFGDLLDADGLANCKALEAMFFLADRNACANALTTSSNAVPLQYGLHEVQSSGLQDIVATTWRHDSELGRGYLLMSEASHNGRVWRWEVGGGPIAIGKTLHLDQAGCRSPNYKDCRDSLLLSYTGSGAIGIDFYKNEHFAEGRLVISEWGEGRIVRLEDNGARTPLVLTRPPLCNNEASDGTSQRVERPTSLIYTPFGDLWFIDHSEACDRSAIFRLRHAVHASTLGSLTESRDAHSWTTIEDGQTSESNKAIGYPELVLSLDGHESIGGLGLSESWTELYAAAKKGDSIVLLKLDLTEEHVEEEEDSEDRKTTTSATAGAQVLFDLSKRVASMKHPGSIAVGSNGHVYWSVPNGILVVDVKRQVVVGKVDLADASPPKSLTLGGDGFLYVASSDRLLRIRVREGSVKVPTNVVVRPE